GSSACLWALACRPPSPAPGRSRPATCQTGTPRRRGRNRGGSGCGIRCTRCSWKGPSMIQQELARVQQAPQHVLKAAFGRGAVLDVLRARLQFLLRRHPAQRPEVERFKSPVPLGNLLDDLRQPPPRRGDLLLEGRVVRQVERLDDGRLAVPL